ncbi:MAG: methylenetetrahydrofolate reductase, partial [Anaerolineales bacterium]|nr:methylenetetrahydrofolate reductase [Anaerolineales bacterium]
MHIAKVLAKPGIHFSFEFFPPKDEAGFQSLFETIERLKSANPAFVSVTYGAGGSTRSKTVNLVGTIKNDIAIESMAHLTCVGHQKDAMVSVLESLQTLGI